MAGTLRLNRAEEKSTDPVFNPDAHHGEVHGASDGVRFIQGKNYFGHKGQFIREAPQECWMAPLSAEQEQARRLQIQKNKKFFGSAKNAAAPAASIPQSVVQAERENAQARAAEHRAA